jgi:hypothetical protein
MGMSTIRNKAAEILPKAVLTGKEDRIPIKEKELTLWF